MAKIVWSNTAFSVTTYVTSSDGTFVLEVVRNSDSAILKFPSQYAAEFEIFIIEMLAECNDDDERSACMNDMFVVFSEYVPESISYPLKKG